MIPRRIFAAALVAGLLLGAVATSKAAPLDVRVFDALKAMEGLPSYTFTEKFNAEFAEKAFVAEGVLEDFRRGTLCRLYVGVWTARGEVYFCPKGEEVRAILQFKPGDPVRISATIVAWNGVDDSLRVGDWELAPAAREVDAEAPPTIEPSPTEPSFPDRGGPSFDSRVIDDMRAAYSRMSSNDFSADFDDRYIGRNFADTGSLGEFRSGATCSIYVAVQTVRGEAYFCPQADEVRAIGAFRRGETVRVRGHIAAFVSYDESLFLADGHISPR